jgi:hypothetical protein
VILLPFLPSAAWACAVCGAATPNDQSAYLVMTIVMSLLPLGLLGGIGFWVYRGATSSDVGP